MKTRIERPSEWFTELLPARVESDPECTGGFEGTFCIHVDGESGGDWTCHLTGGSAHAEPQLTENAAFTMSLSDVNFVKLINGEINARAAYSTGRLKIQGSAADAARLFKLFVV